MAKSNIKIDITADDKATKTLKDLDTQVGKTGEGIGKFGKAAAVGGAAIVALGVKSVLAFEDLGLTVGKFAEATGTTTKEASRLIEVSGDLGISSDTLQSSIGKMSKQLGANEEAFKSYGIEVQKNDDGTTNVNETFLASVDAINAIEDPLKKAEAAAKVFGKGYQGMAELLGKSSDEIRVDLAAVSDAKVFDDKKVQDARDMREAFDSIVDAGQDLLLTIGSALAPAITKIAPLLVEVVEAAAPAAEAIGEVLVSALEALGPIIEGLLPAITLLAKGLGLVATAISALKPGGATASIKEFGASLEDLETKALEAGISQDQFRAILDASTESMAKTGDGQRDLTTLVDTAAQRLDELAHSTKETDRETRRLGDTNNDLVDDVEETVEVVDNLTASLAEADAAYQSLTGKLDEEDSWANVQESIVAFKELVDPTAQDVRDLTRDLADYIDKSNLIPAEKKTRYIAELDEGKLALVEQQLAILTRNRTINIDLIGKGAAGYGGLTGAHALGGRIPMSEGLSLVGEDGPELISAPGSTVYTADQTAALLFSRGRKSGGPIDYTPGTADERGGVDAGSVNDTEMARRAAERRRQEEEAAAAAALNGVGVRLEAAAAELDFDVPWQRQSVQSNFGRSGDCDCGDTYNIYVQAGVDGYLAGKRIIAQLSEVQRRSGKF